MRPVWRAGRFADGSAVECGLCGCSEERIKTAKWEAYINRQARNSCSPEEFPCCREDGTPRDSKQPSRWARQRRNKLWGKESKQWDAKATMAELPQDCKMGKTAGGRSAKKPVKPGHSIKKKGTDTEGRKPGGKGKQVTQTVKRKAKEDSDCSPVGEKGFSKKVKLTSAKIASWKTLSESSRQFLETVMDSIILSILCQQRERKSVVQDRLNLLKERVLRCFRTIKVPPQKLGNLKNLSNLQMVEKETLKANEESLVRLQEEINEAKQSAGRREENILQLQNKIQVLKNQLEEDEKKAKKVFQENVSGALHLPELPKRSLQAPTLQEEILKMKNQEGLLKDMNTIQQSADLKDLLTLIEKTYEKVDFL
ncbi:centromere protein Q isoform X2 [Melopsittacus undulatus]|uniref:centromere protein Q isoform X2 n=1 Tax=Melopsittacus undulatus TaxID=13146 RepID=UPI00146BDC90|nr:centromere protein Q isoform X2 [Melopsittacus undulatus]